MHQLIIIGAGPAGITAGIYAERYGIKYLIIGPNIGGAINEAHIVDNYPGFKSITGPELTKKFEKHLNTPIKKEQVEKITKKKGVFEITTDKDRYQAKAVILSLGMKIRKLGIKNEEKFLGKGISYYTPHDLNSVKDKIIAIVGGGDSALTAALKTSDQAKGVYLIHRRDEFRGAPALVKKVKQKANIKIIYSGQVLEVFGKTKLEKIVLNTEEEIEVNNLFLEIGGVPNIQLCSDLNLSMDNNFIIVDKKQATNLAGFFAAGDITNNPLKQIVTAAAEGAIAATSAYIHIKQNS